MKKLWTGRSAGNTDPFADAFASSIGVDRRLYQEDIAGSIAHAAMLGRQGILPAQAVSHIIAGLQKIRADLAGGILKVDAAAEDIHMFIEQKLTEQIGQEGEMLHTARSRNDQTTLDLRLALRSQGRDIAGRLRQLIRTLSDLAEQNKDTIMPGYTHLQRAQPVSFGHHLMAYAMMFLRDSSRLQDWQKRMDDSPIGSCALAGTTYPVDRQYEADKLGFSRVSMNSMDSVADRDFALEALAVFSLIMMHLSRFSEEIVLWTSWEFQFIELADAYTTGSSIMPQKKNSDAAELVRGKTGRVYGDMIALFTVMKGLPMTYDRDMQEDKEAVFDAADTVRQCLQIFPQMLTTMKIRKDSMLKAAQQGFLNATDLADYLTRKGMPFRSAYRLSGQIVAACIRQGKILETLPLAEYQKYSELFAADLYDAIDLKNCVYRRTSEGGTSVASVQRQILYVRNLLQQQEEQSDDRSV